MSPVPPRLPILTGLWPAGDQTEPKSQVYLLSFVSRRPDYEKGVKLRAFE